MIIKKIVWLFIIIGVVFTGFVFYSSLNKEGKKNLVSSKIPAVSTPTSKSKLPPRQMSGIFHLPANGEVIDKDIHGKELPYGVGVRLQFKQLGVLGKFTLVNKDIPSWSTGKLEVTSGIAISPGKIELKNTEKNPVTVLVRIIPYRGPS